MTEGQDGLAIARDRIAQEAEARSGFLDLGRLGLRVLPDVLFQLKHLQQLNLGHGIYDGNGEWVAAASDIAYNELGDSLVRLAELIGLLLPIRRWDTVN